MSTTKKMLFDPVEELTEALVLDSEPEEDSTEEEI